ncbi:MAG: hypothetical protein MJZ21_03795, partial [archaeon]|nr:hypothetical protein [archaeon]
MTRKQIALLGYIAAIIFFGCWGLGIILDGSWTYGSNALSDLGVSDSTAAAMLFNLGVCIISSIVWTLEMIGIFRLGDGLCKMYALFTIVSMVFLFLVGVFNESYGELHGTVATFYG